MWALFNCGVNFDLSLTTHEIFVTLKVIIIEVFMR